MQSDKVDVAYILTDLLNCQKLLTGSYNNLANHANSEIISAEILALLIEEHQIKTELVAEINKRKLLKSSPANQDNIAKLKETFRPNLQ